MKPQTKLLKQLKLSGKTLSDIQAETGIPLRTLQKMFYRGMNSELIIRLAKICKALGCKIESIAGLDEEPTHESVQPNSKRSRSRAKDQTND